MKPSARWLLAGGAAVLFAALATFWLLGRPGDGPSVPPAGGDPVRLQWRTGSAQQYDVRFDSQLRVNPGATGAAAPAVNVRLQGVLDVRALQAGSDEALVGLRLASVALQVAGKSDPATEQALAAPFRVRFASGGMPTAFEFAADTPAEQRAMLEQLVRTFQVAMRPDASWVTHESSATGPYQATYLRTSPTQWQKSKQRIGGAPGAAARPEIRSKESIRIEGDGDWIASMTVDETTRSQGQAGPDFELTNRATLERRADPSARAVDDADAWRFAAAAAAAPAVRASDAARPLSRDEAKQQLADNVATLQAARSGRNVSVHKIRDLLRADPAMPTVLLAAMKSNPFDDRTRADLYLAFELAGTPGAQAALVSVISDSSWSERDAMRAIVALAGVARPTPQTIDALWAAARQGAAGDERSDLANTATFALGSAGQALSSAGDPAYGAVRGGLLQGAVSASDAAQRANFIHALGNTRDPSLSADVVPFLDDPAPAVRGAAAQSLANLGTDQAAGALVTRFEQERNSAVRGAIAESLVSWTAPSAGAMASMRAAIGSEPDENTRYQMARALGRNLATHPENRAALQALMRTEQSRRVRQQVAESLAGPN